MVFSSGIHVRSSLPSVLAKDGMCHPKESIPCARMFARRFFAKTASQLHAEPDFGHDAELDASVILIGSSIILRDWPICSSLGGKDSQVLLAN